MGVTIKCILEQDVPGIPYLEGKSLAMAYCSDADGDATDEIADEEDGDKDSDAGADIITVDFGGVGRSTTSSGSTSSESLLAPLDPFMAADGGLEWHDPASGLAAVRSILAKLRAGATVAISPDFVFGDEDEEELTEGVRADLEDLEKILAAAAEAGTRFYLAFDV